MITKESDFTTVPSPGERLKEKRIEYGISLQEVASSLLLSADHIKALENDRYEDLPGLTYIVGYWKSYASFFDMDISHEIEIHKNKLKASDAHAIHFYNRYTGINQEKHRKYSVFLFFLVLATFLTGLWYWHNSTQDQADQLIGGESGVQVNILNNQNGATDDASDGLNGTVLLFQESGDTDQQKSADSVPEPDFEEEPVEDSGLGNQSNASLGNQPDTGSDSQPDAGSVEETVESNAGN